jgi:hypothetical protein
VVIPTLVGLAVLSLLGGLASIRRVLRLDPIAVVREGGGGVR